MSDTYGMDLKLWLVRNGVKAYHFAAQLGIAAPTLSQIMSGRKLPAEELMGRIEKAKAGFKVNDIE